MDTYTRKILVIAIFLFGGLVVHAQVNQWSSSLPLNHPIVQDALSAAPADVNTCGTSAGQTPFTIDAQVMSNYNGFGVSCKDTCNGVVEVTVTGGVGPFTYQWVGGPNTAQWTTACGGTALVIVTDQGQGIQCATQVLVIEPSALSIIIVPPGFQDPSCSGVCDGEATVIAVGGAGFYSYDWNSGQGNSNSADFLCEGLNTLDVDDQNGCALDTSFILIREPITPNEQIQDVSCAGNCDGSIALDVTGGASPYTYVWSPVPPFGQGTDSIADLCSGNYDVTITDANNCDTVISFVINEPLPIAPNEVITDALCWNSCDGEATVNPSDAVGPFTYDWTPDPTGGDGGNVAQGFCPGVVTVLITDQATGCDTLLELTIGSPPVLDPQLTTTDALCAGDCDGTATVNPVGGTPGYTFTWNPAPPVGQGTASVSGLCAGSYTVLISDVNNCDTLVSFDILEPTPITPIPSSTDITCFGVCDGTASVSVGGGTPGYTYVWTPAPPFGQGTDSISGLCEGMWSVVISDINGCDTLLEFTIVEPDSLTAVLDITNASCTGDCNGAVNVVLSGGRPPYSYNWLPAPPLGQGTDMVSGLCAGAYTLEVTDSSNCLTVIPFSITEPGLFNVITTIQDPSCGSTCDGGASLQVSGSNGSSNADYTYLWTPNPLTGQGTATVTGLCLGNSTVLITDSLGCDTLIDIIINTPPLIVPNETVTNASCFGDCDGQINLSPAGGIGPLTVTWTPVPPGGQGITNATGLCAGSYSIVISDTTGCDTTFTIDITQPDPFIITSNQTDASCWDVCDGTADILVQGGTGPFTFAWSPAPGSLSGTDSTSIATGLCGGDYDVTITDSFGCDSIFRVTILEPDSITNVATIASISCGNVCDGSIDLVSTGGTGILGYSWSPIPPVGDGTPNISGLCVGMYTVTITDQNNCSVQETFTIDPPTPIDVQITPIDATCGGLCDGSATATVSGGAGSTYTYFWNPAPPNGQGTASASGFCEGSYNLTVTDSVGCDTTVSFVINAPDSIIAAPVVQDASCFGVCDGSIALNPSGGTGTLSVTWNPIPPSGANDPNATGLCAGQWSATITDQVGCDTTIDFTINEPAPLSITDSLENPTCAGECNGSIVLTVVGPQPLIYLWTPTPPVGDGTASVSGLCAGQYSVVITDGNGCDSTLVFDLVDPQPLLATLTTTPSACGGACIGTASLVVTGGTGPISYLWSPAPINGQGTPNVTDLCSGAYSVVVSDSLGCDTTLSFTISSPSGINAVPTISDATCANVCDGTIAIAATGGAPPFNYTWSPAPPMGDGTPNVSGLCPGVYTLTIDDQAGCDTTLILNVGSATLIDPQEDVTQVLCNAACTGEIALNTVGGNPPYTYQWTPAPPNGQGVDTAMSLCAGTYDLTITDGNGCDTSLTFVINEPPPYNITLSTTTDPCEVCMGTAAVDVLGATPGYTITWFDDMGTPIANNTDSISMLCTGSYSVLISDANNCDSTITFDLVDPEPIVPVLTTTPSACDGSCLGTASLVVTGGTGSLTYLWSPAPITGQGTPNVTDLCAGAYTVVVTDSLGCDTTLNFTISSPSNINAIPAVSDATCNAVCNGTITLAVTGGSAPLNYSWSPTPPLGDGTPSVAGLCPDTYTVQITDQVGCDTTITVVVGSATQILPSEVLTQVDCNGECTGAITLAPSGGNPPYNFTWNPVPPNGPGTNSATGLCAGTYDVTVSDANGCDTTLSLTITEPPAFDITLNTTLSLCSVCSGTAALDVLGATPGYSFTWFDDLGATIGSTDSISMLCAGSYSVNIQDALGCDTTLLFIIADADGEVLTTSSIDAACADSCNGMAIVSFTCSDPPCVIDWLDVNGLSIGQTSDTAMMLCPGSYFPVVTNASGCVSTDTVDVSAPDGYTASLIITDVACGGLCNGSALVNISGGVGPFTYFWNPAPPIGQNTDLAQGLCGGNYTVTISDAGGCDTTIAFAILEPSALAIVDSVIHETCTNDCDGQIGLIVSGGTAPYTYQWTPAPPVGQGTDTVSGLCPGIYSVVVFDANNCTVQLSYTIQAAPPIIYSVQTTPTNCGQCTGTGQVSASGGSGSLSYLWLDDQGVQVANSASANFLCAGIYAVSITDSLGCDTTFSVPIVDAQGETLTVSSFSPSCLNGCDGGAVVSFVCNDPPCLIDWSDAAGNSLSVSNDTLTPVCAGSYFVTVTNNSSCVTIEPVNVDPAPGMNPTFVTTNVSCDGVCDGSASVTVTGGMMPYTYLWSPAPGGGQGTADATGLCEILYTCTIQDALGCDTVLQIQMQDVTDIALSASVVQNDCAGDCNGSITVTPSGGTPPYSYQWTPIPPNGQGTFEAIGLCAGNYQLTIFDSNNCDTTVSFGILDPLPLDVTLSTDSSTCGNSDGSAFVTVSGGTGSYSYNWTNQSNTTISTTDTANGLAAGLYSVLVSDSLGCDTLISFAISDINGELITTSFTPPSCNGSCDATATVSFICSNPPCNVDWADDNGVSIGQTTNTATALCPGLYFVNVTNALGCVTIDSVNVQDAQFGSISLGATAVNCFGQCDGTATVTVTGAQLPITYVWSPAPMIGQGTDSISGLCAGTYSVQLTDAAGCDTLVSVLVQSPNQLIVGSVVNDANCFGQCDGSILLTPIGGTPPYAYNWSPVPPNGQGNNEATQLCAGNYSVTVSDFNGCDTVLNFTINEPPAITLGLTATQSILCYGDCIGTAVAVVGGGSPPYSITWTDSLGATIATDTLSVSGLCGGSYTLSILDDAGCLIDTTFSIFQPAPIETNLFFTNEGCNQPCDAYALISPMGGNGGPYTVTWFPQPSFVGQDSAFGFCVGTYTLTVTDAQGCDTVQSFTVNSAIPISASSNFSDVSCFGFDDGWISVAATGGTGVFSYQWTPPPPFGQGTDSIYGLPPNNYSVVVSDSLGCDTTLNFTITEPLPLTVQLLQTVSPLCATVNDGIISVAANGGSSPYVYQWTGPNGFISFSDSISNLFPGVYNLTVLDDANCQASLQVQLDPVLVVDAVITGDTAVCLGSTILLDGGNSQSALSYEWIDSLGNVIGTNDTLFYTADAVGTVDLILNVFNGPSCSDSDTITITSWPLPFADAGIDQVVYNPDNPIQLGGNPTALNGNSVMWVPDSALNDPTLYDPLFTPGGTTWFVLFVTDSNGCVANDSVLIEVFPELEPPSGFSPNGDGMNDVWVLEIADLFPDLTVDVYNRWGEPLFTSIGYTVPWDGKYDGKPLPIGTYYYVINLNDPEFPEPLTGPVTLLR